MRLILSITFFFIYLIGYCQDTTIIRSYSLLYGSNPNIESGAVSSIGTSSLIFDQLNHSIKRIKNRPLSFSARLLNFSLLQFYFGSQLYATLPHEYFGHYSRAREFGIESNVQSNFPGIGGSTTLFLSQSIPTIQRQMIMAAGPEVTAEIAYKATQELYSADYVPTYFGNYLLAGKLIDQFFYYQNNVRPFIEDPNKYLIDNRVELQKNPVGNDPFSYTLALTESYGYYDSFLDKKALWVQQFPDMTVYTKNEFIKDQSKRMNTAYLMAALDPTNLYFLYGNALYLITGKSYFRPFMFRLRKVNFMPSVRVNAGELGIENYYDVFFKIKNYPSFNIYYRTGGNLIHHINGFGVSFRKIHLNSRISVDAELDYWNNDRTNKNSFNVSSIWHLSNRNHTMSSLWALGYKSEGNLMGKTFGAGLYGYVGIKLQLKYSP